MTEDQFQVGNFIRRILQYQKLVSQVVDYGIGTQYDDRNLIEFFVKVDKDMIFIDSAVARKVADFCQLLNEAKNFGGATLPEIEEVYRSLVNAHPFDLSLCESLATFLNNVQDQPQQAKMVLEAGIKLAEQKLIELRKLHIEIGE